MAKSELLQILDDEERLPEIQGKTPDSKEEVWVAVALYKYNEPFIFQYAIAGGASIRGGLVIDFLLTRQGIPLEVYGDYWHENELPGRDLIRITTMRQYFGVDPLILWAVDAQTPEDVVQWVRRNVAR